MLLNYEYAPVVPRQIEESAVVSTSGWSNLSTFQSQKLFKMLACDLLLFLAKTESQSTSLIAVKWVAF
jgi:hypothetical protein